MESLIDMQIIPDTSIHKSDCLEMDALHKCACLKIAVTQATGYDFRNLPRSNQHAWMMMPRRGSPGLRCA